MKNLIALVVAGLISSAAYAGLPDVSEANTLEDDFPGLYSNEEQSREVRQPEVGDSTVGEDIFQTYEESDLLK